MIDQSVRAATMTVEGIEGHEVLWNAEQRSDLLGNFTRTKRGDAWRIYKPFSQMVSFPMNPGQSSTVRVLETESAGKRSWDQEVRIEVLGEEEIETPAGRFRAMKLGREVRWTERDKPTNNGVNRWTYWYSGQAKRWIMAEHTNVTAGGKTIASERWELESYKVR
jgi:hypothetical protein